jgi:DNA repair exonuclease SbcCD nuclease subunit
MIQNTQCQILMGHLQVSGFEQHIGSWNNEGLESHIFDKFDMVMSGHFHHRSNNGTVYYLGNPYEITWSDYKDPRGFHIFDTETRELNFIVNPYRMFHKLFYDDSAETFESLSEKDYSEYEGTYVKVVVEKKTNPFWFDSVLDKLEEVNVADLVVVENFSDFDISDDDIVDQAEDTLTILSGYVESLNVENKVELDGLMRSLYNEALTVETS